METSPKSLQKKHKSNPDLSSSYTTAVLASTSNTTSILRLQHNLRKKKIYAKEELLEKRKQLENEMRQLDMRENHPAWLQMKGLVVDHSGIQAKTEERLLEAKEREREFKLELEKMMIRVQNQPTLFERQSAVKILFSLKSFALL